jgi:two-component system OmpR family sensor kinase
VTVNATFDRLQAAITRERTFAANAGHELRTPLTILKAEVDSALASPRSPHELRDALGSAAGEIRHLIAIAEGLLVIARSADGQMPVQRSPVHLATLISERVAAFAPRASGHGVELVERVDDVIVDLDPTRLRQAIDNVLDNATRHATSGRVTVTGSASAGVVSIVIDDDGPGFSEATLTAAFQPFNRPAGDVSGTGLGLALARAITQAHGGNAEARNRPGGGASVTLRFAVSQIFAPGAGARPGDAQPLVDRS